jgi:hypothetical protein
MPKVLEDLLWCAALATWLMLFCGFIVTALRPTRGQAEVEGKAKLSNDVLAKIVVLLAALLVWRTSEILHPSQCEANCPTEFSDSRR